MSNIKIARHNKVYLCEVCGKSFKRGIYIASTHLFTHMCPDCATKLGSSLNKFMEDYNWDSVLHPSGDASVDTKEELINTFMSAIGEGSKYVALLMDMPDSPVREIIIIQRPNFDNKLKFYVEEYDDKLCKKSNQEIRIVDACIVDAIEDIPKYFSSNK